MSPLQELVRHGYRSEFLIEKRPSPESRKIQNRPPLSLAILDNASRIVTPSRFKENF